MKLLDKYNRLNITATILAFVFGSCAFYFLLHYILIHQLDESLQTEQQEITTYVKTHNALPEIIPTKGQYTTYQAAMGKTATTFSNVKYKHEKGKEHLRQIQFSIMAGGTWYLVTVAEPREETEDLLQVIIGITIAMVAIILLLTYLINRIVIQRLWKPFYNTIATVRSYHLTEQPALKLEHTDTDEFMLLNQSINEMTERIQQDYGSLKNFTGQAAHEMQTPLAVIRTKLDTLIQNEAVLEKNAQHIIDIEKAVQRLSRLHQSLLLLTRVENKQFVLNEEVQLDKIIEDKCAEYTEMVEAMHIHITPHLQPVTVQFHQHLAEILVSNLVNNAVRHNKTEGTINITLTERELAVSNTSEHSRLDGDKLFKRFYRGNSATEGTGLGLSIVKHICDFAGYRIEYKYVDGFHTFIIYFRS